MNDHEKGLIICGAQGSGKTRLAKQIARNHLTEKIYFNNAPFFNLKPGEHKKYHIIIYDALDQLVHFAQACAFIPPVHRHKLVLATSMTAQELQDISYIQESFTIVTLSSII